MIEEEIEYDTFHYRLMVFINQNYKSKSEFARKMGIPISTLNSMFTLKINPSYKTLLSFIEHYPCEVLVYLMTGDEDVSKVSETKGFYLVDKDPYQKLTNAIRDVVKEEVKNIAQKEI